MAAANGGLVDDADAALADVDEVATEAAVVARLSMGRLVRLVDAMVQFVLCVPCRVPHPMHLNLK